MGILAQINMDRAGNGLRDVVGEDTVAMTKCRLQVRTLVTQDGTNGVKMMKCFTSNLVSSASSVNDSFKQLHVDTLELESISSSAIKRPRLEATQHSGLRIKSICGRLKEKEGRITGNLMGKRVDFLARTVFTTDPMINIDESGVPWSIVLNLTYPKTVTLYNKERN